MKLMAAIHNIQINSRNLPVMNHWANFAVACKELQTPDLFFLARDTEELGHWPLKCIQIQINISFINLSKYDLVCMFGRQAKETGRLSCHKSGIILGYLNRRDWKSSIHHLTRLTCMVFSQFFSLLMPALLITMSRRPNVSTVLWNASVRQKQRAVSERLQTLAQHHTRRELNHFQLTPR